MPGNIKLVLEDGSEFNGQSFGYEGSVAGEIVFNTAMTGYPESLTDPSYKGQILVITYPLIGNYGVPGDLQENTLSKYFESERIHASGLIISDYSFKYNHWNAVQSLGDWLISNQVPGIYGLDTRSLTRRIREKGSMLARIVYNQDVIDWWDPNKVNLVDQVSIKEKKIYGKGRYKILLVDCGVKNNIIRYLLTFDTTVIRVPWNHDLSDEKFDGIFLSNGPGDPTQCDVTINNLKPILEGNHPVFGICLGHQLLSLAAGAQTFKLKFGHRSHNQPVLRVGMNKAYITSQNHGFAVDTETIPDGWEPFFINLNDNTNEGIRHSRKPFFTTQFHPEASGGPTDTAFLFDHFMELVKERAR